MIKNKTLFVFFFCLFSISFTKPLFGQATLEVIVLDGASSTTCTDFFSPPDTVWGVNVENTAWVTYPELDGCFINPPHQNFVTSFPCLADLPDSIEICFRAFENDGLFCNVTPACEVQVCEMIAVDILQDTTFHTLSTPLGGASEGTVDIAIVTQMGIQAVNDLPCQAIYFDTLVPGVPVGDFLLGAYNNICATNLNEPDPLDVGFWNNDQAVWFSFTTGPDPLPYLLIQGVNDPAGIGDTIDLQFALYEATADTCDGPLVFVERSYDITDFDETFLVECLDPYTTYFLLVDGAPNFGATNTSGIFGLSILDPDVDEAPDFRCDALEIDTIPAGGSITLTQQSNKCATNVGDPNNPTFGVGNGVWYQFTAPATGDVIIEAFNDSIPLDPIDLELAVFSSPNDTCLLPFVHEGSQHTGGNFDETLLLPCLQPFGTYWLMIDGSAQDSRGIYSITISDGGTPQPSSSIDTILCFGGSITVGGSVYNTTGMFTHVIPSLDPAECDSLVYIDLTIQPLLVASGSEVAPSTSIALPNGVGSVSISGGTPPYSLQWPGGQTADTVGNLSPGLYCVLVTDSIGCQDTACLTITELIIPPVLNVLNDSLSCFGDTDGVLAVQVLSGTPPYTYTWTQVGTGNGGNSTLPNEGDTILVNNLPGGVYQVMVTDSNLLLSDIEFSIYQPDSLTITATTQEPSCFGICDGIISLQVSGGTPPYVYIWPNGNNVQADSSLCDGTYSVTVSDANACLADITVSLNQPPEFIATATLVNSVTCFGDADGAASVSTNGNPVLFSWSNGEMASTANQLSGGPQSVTVTNTDGCLDTAFIDIPAPDSALTLSLVQTEEIICFGGNEGEIQSVVEGGSGAPYTYNWSSGWTSPTLLSANAGQYTLTVTDNFNCTVEESILLTEPTEIQASYSSTDATCLEGGSIIIDTVFGGADSFLYAINDLVFTNQTTYLDLPAGIQSFFIRDTGGCIISIPVTIFPPPIVSVDAGPDITVSLGETVDLLGSSNVTNPIVSWSPPELLDCADCLNPSFLPTFNESFTLTVLDTTTGCNASDDVRVFVKEQRNVFIPNVFSPDNNGVNDVFKVQGGIGVEQVKSLRVFNRWGGEVYSIQNIPADFNAPGWDGTEGGKRVQPGVYIYIAEVEFIDKQVILYKGDVTVVY